MNVAITLVISKRWTLTKAKARGCASACPGPTKPFKLPAVRLATVC
jgi:hypothetical protein